MKSFRSFLYIATLVVLVAICGTVLVHRTKGASSTQPAATKPAGTLVIRKAIYGDLPDGTTVDVADKVRAMVKDGTLSVAATDGNFGDPYDGKMKLTITEAAWMNGPFKLVDMTDFVKSQQNHNSLHTSSKGDMQLVVHYNWGDGKDCVAYQGKDGTVDITLPTKLRVDYTANGVDASKTVDLNHGLKINANDPIAVAQPPVNIADTVWSIDDSDGDHYDFQFKADGSMVKASNNAGGTWKQDGASISIELNHYARYQGTVAGTHIDGTASNDAGKNWTWSADKK